MKKLLYIFMVLTIIITLSACETKPKGDPAQALNDYYQDIKDSNLEGAYGLLATETTKNFPKEDYVTWQKYNKETETLKSVKVENSNEYKNKEIDGTTYKNAVEFNVTETGQDLFNDKEVTRNYKRYVVNDNGSWKVYREKADSKELIAKVMVDLANMYSEGKGKPKDLNQAATILNNALQYSENLPQVYYYLGRTYLDLTRYDEALDAINKCISKASDDTGKSSAYTVLGSIYVYKHQFGDAKNAYNKALELNPNNQYAKTNLQNLK